MNLKRTSSGARAGFTLIELLVAIGIMILIMGITMPFIAAMGRGTGMANTTNEISASLVAARAVAMKEGKDAAIIFQGSGTNNDGPIRCTIVLRNTTDTNAGFAPYEKRDGTNLPAHCRVAGVTTFKQSPGDSLAVWTRPDTVDPAPTAVNTRAWIGVCFGSDGRVKNLDSALTGSGTSTAYYDQNSSSSLTAASGIFEQKITFVPVLATYDARTLTDADNENSPTGLRQFINAELADIDAAAAKRVRVLYFDSYTGQILK
jgi:prepilin-type N-terminal cleavage/methylation domain-containing protein